eukprot:CAMPEP_0116141104 /NCGR_PEP_ID=MMETSP0329-20121206/14205_1 /TAXON_ID=697910 /ORGANISM="Pseudo-nitzschia arenysensis, Strain B593" /LENGTH=576 /DNA_ID=CAMNT_0003636267 /DNA_START=29 /DNA_END=1759 /DNA_ORIENTATION=+
MATTTLPNGVAYAFSVIPVVSSMNWSENDNWQQRIIINLWGHLTVFFNLSAVMTEALQNNNIGLSKRQEAVRMILQILPISCWWPMILVTVASILVETTTSVEGFLSIGALWKLSLWAFLATFLFLWFLRAVTARRRKISADLQGMPTTVTTTGDLSGGIIARICVMEPYSGYNSKPAVDAAPRNACYLEERQWYTWSKLETMQWFVQQLQQGQSGEKSQKIVSLLARQCITGDVLDCLADVSQLVALRIPFGPACRLSDAIAGLVERYPKPRIINGIRQRSRRGDAMTSNELRFSRHCLDLHDDEYNSRSNNNRGEYNDSEQQLKPPTNEQSTMGGNEELHQRRPEPPSHPQPQQAFQNGSGNKMSEEQHEKLNQVMKDRFGLELPKLRATDFLEVQKGLKAQNGRTAPLPNEGMTQPFPFGTNGEPPMRNSNYSNGTTAVPIAQTLPTNGSPSVPTRNASPSIQSTGIPDQILKGMPPELQEIAKRRPDLVETIWKQKQQQQQQQQQQALQGRQPTKARLAALPESSRDIENFEEEFDSDNEDETTSLIQSDAIHREHPGRYKSVDKSMHPSLV